MIIKSIELFNFRQFKHAKFDFSMSDDKKFTVILGDNSCGKTTLIKAFIWCLYKENKYKGNEKILLNNDVLKHMNINEKQEVKIVLELIHNDSQYTITTKQNFFSNSNGNIVDEEPLTTISILEKNKGVTPIPQKLVADTIDEILDKDLINYFFYEGENNPISKSTTKKNLQEAIKNVLGFEKVMELHDFFDAQKPKNVIDYFKNNKITNIDIDPFKVNDMKSDVTDFKENIATNNANIADLEADIEELKTQINEYEEIINSFKDTQKLQNKAASLSKEIRTLSENQIIDYNNILIRFNNNHMLKILLNYNFVINNLKTELEKSSFSADSDISNIDSKAVDQLIKRGYCLCGAKIENGNDAYKHLEESKLHMAPSNYGAYIKDFLDVENAYQPIFAQEEIIDSINRYLGKIEKIDENHLEIKHIQKEIEGKPEVSQYQQKVNNLNQQIGSKKEMIRTKQNTNEHLKVEIANIEDKLNKYYSSTKENAFCDECIKYAQYIENYSKMHIEKNFAKKREELEIIVNDVFNQMSKEKRNISIDSKFTVDSKQKSTNQDLKPGDGVNTILNYAFVIGLILLIKNKQDDDILNPESDKIYPLILDAPFSTLDNQHISNICRVLAEKCNQTIIAVMPKDFNNAKNDIKELIGKSYELVKITDDVTEVKEVIF